MLIVKLISGTSTYSLLPIPYILCRESPIFKCSCDTDPKIGSLQDELNTGKTVYAPKDTSKKRKRSAESETVRKEPKKSRTHGDDDDHDFIAISDDNEESDSDSDSDSRIPLTSKDIERKIAELKKTKKEARRENSAIDLAIKTTNVKVESLKEKMAEIGGKRSAICIAGRNKYSKRAIQQDFAAGIRELDQENAQEADEDNFDPEEDFRDYDEVARSLPVFCVSSRAYQKLSGRLIKDSDVPGFRTAEETEIPQLQVHCKNLTRAGRASNCRRILSDLSQLLNSLSLWASNDGAGMKVSADELQSEAHFLKTKLNRLEKELQITVTENLQEMKTTLTESLYNDLTDGIQKAVKEASSIAHKWGLLSNQENRGLGGLCWSTYRAVCKYVFIFASRLVPYVVLCYRRNLRE